MKFNQSNGSKISLLHLEYFLEMKQVSRILNCLQPAFLCMPEIEGKDMSEPMRRSWQYKKHTFVLCSLGLCNAL